jgi:hypothetical protein
MYINSYIESSMIDLSQVVLKKLSKYVQLKSTLVITVLYYCTYTDIVEMLVNLLYSLI